jgi:hypothetical protein
MKTPKYTGVEVRKFDLFGWLMCILGLWCIWTFTTTREWTLVFLSFLCFWDYVIRVSFGRVYKHVYYDTILYPMYELEVDMADETYFVCAENQDELDLYMEQHYPNMKYKILRETHVESYIKTEEFQ